VDNISLPKTTEDNLNEFQEQQVIDFIDKEIAPQAEGGEVGAESI